MCDINVLIKNGIKVNKCIELFGSIELYNESMKDFFGGTNSKVKELTRYVENEDLGGYAIEIHALKSSSRYLGFDKLSEIAISLEKSCISNDIDEVKKYHPILLERIKDYAAIAKEYFGSSKEEKNSDTPVLESGHTWNLKQVDDGSSIVNQILKESNDEVKSESTKPSVNIQSDVFENLNNTQLVKPLKEEMPSYPVDAFAKKNDSINEELPSIDSIPTLNSKTIRQTYNQPVSSYDNTSKQSAYPSISNSRVESFNEIKYQAPEVKKETPINISLYSTSISNERNLSGFEDSNSIRVATPEVKDIPIKRADVDHLPTYEYRPISVIPTNVKKVSSEGAPGEEVRPIIIPKLRKDKILIVDDSDMIINFVTRILSNDYEILPVKNGEEALRLLDNRSFRDSLKLCLLDLNMPNINGYEVLEHCKQNNYFKDVPFIVESGVEDTSSLDKLNAYPVEGILLKPYKESDLRRVVEKTYATYFNN